MRNIDISKIPSRPVRKRLYIQQEIEKQKLLNKEKEFKLISNSILKIYEINNIGVYKDLIPSFVLDFYDIENSDFNFLFKSLSISYYLHGGDFNIENIFRHLSKAMLATKQLDNILIFVNFKRLNDEIMRYRSEGWSELKLIKELNTLENIKNYGGLVIKKNNINHKLFVIDCSDNCTLGMLSDSLDKAREFCRQWGMYYNKFEDVLYNQLSVRTRYEKEFKLFWNVCVKRSVQSLEVCDLYSFFNIWSRKITKLGKEFKEEVINNFINKFLNEKDCYFIDEIIKESFISNNRKGDPMTHLERLVFKYMRESENEVRIFHGIPKIGEKNVSEIKLYYEVKMKLPQYNVIHQGNPKWLGRQRLDIYIPELNVAIEYQGGQHHDPNHYYNSFNLDSFEKNKERDEKKRVKCKNNGCKLIYVYEGVKYDIDYIIKKIIE